VLEKFKTPEDAQSNTINSAFLDYDQQDQSIVKTIMFSLSFTLTIVVLKTR